MENRSIYYSYSPMKRMPAYTYEKGIDQFVNSVTVDSSQLFHTATKLLPENSPQLTSILSSLSAYSPRFHCLIESKQATNYIANFGEQHQPPGDIYEFLSDEKKLFFQPEDLRFVGYITQSSALRLSMPYIELTIIEEKKYGHTFLSSGLRITTDLLLDYEQFHSDPSDILILPRRKIMDDLEFLLKFIPSKDTTLSMESKVTKSLNS